MSYINERLSAVSLELAQLRSKVASFGPGPQIFAAMGERIFYGCKVTEGASASDMVVSLEGAAAGDELVSNPHAALAPVRDWQYPNIASLKDGAFYSMDMQATVSPAPTGGLGRFDIAYIYVGPFGAGFAVQEGTPSAAAATEFTDNGISTAKYGSGFAFDPPLPLGAQAVARIYVGSDVTGIPNARIADIRSFAGNMASTINQTLLESVGVIVQGHSNKLDALAGLSGGANVVPYFTGTGTMAQTSFTSFGRSVVGAADAAAGRTALGLGSAATQASNSFAPASHAHSIANITNLQSSLDAKLNASVYTASDILTKIKTVDGSGSGLDADLLDGKHYSQLKTEWENYADAAVSELVGSAPAALDTLHELSNALGSDPNFATTTSTALGNRLRVDVNNQGLNSTQRANALTNLGITATSAELSYVSGVTSAIQAQINNKLDSSSYTDADVLNKIKTVDGSGSGLDADLLDGQEGSYYRNASNINAGTLADARLPASMSGKTFTGTVTVAASTTAAPSMKLTAGAAPSSPVDGDVWRTANGMPVVRVGSSDRTLAHSAQWSLISEAEIDGGTATTSRLISAQRIKYILDNKVAAPRPVVTQVEAESGSVTEVRDWTPERVKQAIAALAPLVSGSGSVTSVGTGDGLTGGPISTSGTISVDATVLRTTGGQTIAANSSSAALAVNNSGAGASLSVNKQIVSTLATGTAPFSVASTTAVANLNADLLDGQHGSYYQNASNINAGTLADARLPGSMAGKTFTSPIKVTGSFNIDGSAAGDTQPTGLYVVDSGTTSGTTGNPTATAILVAQHSNIRSIALTVDQQGYLWGYRKHTSEGITYQFQSKTKFADRLTTSRTIALTGGVTGSASFDGSGNISIAATVVGSGHTHTIANVDGLQTALDAKLASSAYTASGVLSKLLTVDGASSGLDADLLDGQEGSYYRNASNLNAGTISDARLPATMAGKTFSSPIKVQSTFNINASSGSDSQADGLYVAEFGTTVGTTKNPTLTAAIVAQLNTNRSIAMTVDSSGYVWGYRKHTNSATYEFQSKTKFADRLTSARTIALTGGVTGSVSFDGSANVSIATTVGSHGHIISDVFGLQGVLDSKADARSVVSQAEAEAGTATTVRDWTALRVRQAVAAGIAAEGGAGGGSNVLKMTAKGDIAVGDALCLDVATQRAAPVAAGINGFSQLGSAVPAGTQMLFPLSNPTHMLSIRQSGGIVAELYELSADGPVLKGSATYTAATTTHALTGSWSEQLANGKHQFALLWVDGANKATARSLTVDLATDEIVFSSGTQFYTNALTGGTAVAAKLTRQALDSENSNAGFLAVVSTFNSGTYTYLVFHVGSGGQALPDAGSPHSLGTNTVGPAGWDVAWCPNVGRFVFTRVNGTAVSSVVITPDYGDYIPSAGSAINDFSISGTTCHALKLQYDPATERLAIAFNREGTVYIRSFTVSNTSVADQAGVISYTGAVTGDTLGVNIQSAINPSSGETYFMWVNADLSLQVVKFLASGTAVTEESAITSVAGAVAYHGFSLGGYASAGRIVMSIRPSNASSDVNVWYLSLAQMDAGLTDPVMLGFAKTAAADGAQVEIYGLGAEVGGFSGLTPGLRYVATVSGGLTEASSPAHPMLMGRALTASKLQILAGLV